MKRSPHRRRQGNLADAPHRANELDRDGPRAPYVAAGPHAALAFVRARPRAVRQVAVHRSVDAELRRAIEDAGIRAEPAEPADLDRLCAGVPHQGIVAVGEPPPGISLAAIDAGPSALALVLDGVTDPRNVGAMIRTASAAGVAAVIMARDRAPGLSPALVKAAAGAVEWVPIARVVNLARSLGELAERGWWIVGLAADVETSLYEAGAIPGMPCALVAGAEGSGLRPLTRRVCHRLVRIPMSGPVASLNVSVAVALALFEIRRAAAPIPATHRGGTI